MEFLELTLSAAADIDQKATPTYCESNNHGVIEHHKVKPSREKKNKKSLCWLASNLSQLLLGQATIPTSSWSETLNGSATWIGEKGISRGEKKRIKLEAAAVRKKSLLESERCSHRQRRRKGRRTGRKPWIRLVPMCCQKYIHRNDHLHEGQRHPLMMHSNEKSCCRYCHSLTRTAHHENGQMWSS